MSTLFLGALFIVQTALVAACLVMLLSLNRRLSILARQSQPDAARPARAPLVPSPVPEPVPALREPEPEPAPRPAADFNSRAPLNFNRRSNALRMHYRGSSTEEIAAALTIPRNEVELLLKIDSLCKNVTA
jgi:hypothetical protein